MSRKYKYRTDAENAQIKKKLEQVLAEDRRRDLLRTTLQSVDQTSSVDTSTCRSMLVASPEKLVSPLRSPVKDANGQRIPDKVRLRGRKIHAKPCVYSGMHRTTPIEAPPGEDIGSKRKLSPESKGKGFCFEDLLPSSNFLILLVCLYVCQYAN